MANFATLKAAIAAAIKQNGNNEITGMLLRQSLLAMVDSLGTGYQFKGGAVPSTDPGTPDQKVAYFAGPGTYPNFGAVTIPDGYVGIFYGSGSTWYVATAKTSPFTAVTVASDIIQLMDGATPVYPRTRAEAVFFGNDQTDTLDEKVEEIEGNISQLGQKVGDLDELETTEKESIVGAVNEVKRATSESLPLVNIDNADLEFWDDEHNILVRFVNGHIQTKNFNSENGSGGNSGSLKILFFGNSLTQDAVSYLPLLLEEIAPDLEFTIYIFYNGGLNLTAQYNSYIASPNTPCGIFSVYKKGDGAWTNYSNSKSINWVIANCNFDILCLQEYGNSGQNDATITTAFTNITDWFFTNYSKALRVVSLCDAPGRIDVPGVTTRIEHYNEVFMESCCSQGIIPAGLAITYACSVPELDALGDSGHLSPDGVHAQEGLPCLLQSYVIAMWIFDLLGMPLSIWGSKTRITTAIYNELNVPGANLGSGVVTGTDAQHLAAQKCAIKALKRGRALEIETLNIS